MSTYTKKRARCNRSHSGQGFVEYAFVIAFVAVLIAMGLAWPQSSLANAISSAFKGATNALDGLNTLAQQFGFN